MRLDNVGRWVGSLTEETAAFAKYSILLHAGYAWPPSSSWAAWPSRSNRASPSSLAVGAAA